MKPIKAYKTYQGSLDAERHREKQWRSTKQGAFENSMVSFNETKGCLYYRLGDAAVAPIYELNGEERQKRIKSVRKTVERKEHECLEVLNLILKNGPNRQKSIWEMRANQMKELAKVVKSVMRSTTRQKSVTTSTDNA